MSDIRPVDPFDGTTFDAWHEVYLASQLHGRGDWATPWQREELRAQVRAVSTLRRNTVYAGWSDGRLVGAGWLAMPLRDNLDRAHLAVDVPRATGAVATARPCSPTWSSGRWPRAGP